MLNAKLCRGYWSEGQVLRIRELFSATLWTHFTWWNECGCFFCRVSVLEQKRKGRPHGPPDLKCRGNSCATSCLRQVCLLAVQEAPVPAAPVFAKCPPSRP